MLGLLMAAPLVVRRRWPLAVLLCTALTLLVYYSLHYPAVTPALPLAAALYSASAAGHLRWAVAIIGFYVGADVLVPLLHRYEAPLPLLIHVTERALAMVALALLGEAVRSHRMRVAAAEARLRDLERGRAAETRRRLVEERLRIARDIHDTVGHTISSIAIQAALADQLLVTGSDRARPAVRAVRAASRQALYDLKAAVGVLRVGGAGPEGPDIPAAALDDLDSILAPLRNAGLRVAVDRGPELTDIPPVVGLTAYRIIQESVTNTVRHAAATTVTVSLHRDGTDLVVEVTDDGRTLLPSAGASPGYGIAGMVERAAALGGRLVAGPLPVGGFRVSARLPIGGPA
jgi:signal transduction histidine kinase